MKLISIIRLLLGFKPVKRGYTKRSEYWADVKGNRDKIKKLRGCGVTELQQEMNRLDGLRANKRMSQAEIAYIAGQAQSNIKGGLLPDHHNWNALNKKEDTKCR